MALQIPKCQIKLPDGDVLLPSLDKRHNPRFITFTVVDEQGITLIHSTMEYVREGLTNDLEVILDV